MDSSNYESQLVGLFLQLWGRAEGKEYNPAAILNNAQNPFDNWFGDICGQVNFRYFLIEFKADREGFLEEVQIGSQKPHRTALYQKLELDPDCQQIANHGHFSAYSDEKLSLLAFETYANSAKPISATSETLGIDFDANKPEYNLIFKSQAINFREFYKNLHEEDLSLRNPDSPWIFQKGLGIPEADLERYINCMYSHLEYYEKDPGVLLLGAFDPCTNEFKAVALPPFQMMEALKEKFESITKKMNQELDEQDRPHPYNHPRM